MAGATGLTGRNVVAELVRRGARAVAHVRPDSAQLADWRTRFKALGAEVDVTPWDEDAMTRAFRALRPTLVFALLGTTQARVKQLERAGRDANAASYEAVDYGLTSMLLRAAVASGARPRFVYLSALGAKEGTRSSYLSVRVRIEKELRESGLPYVVARPSFILGDRDERRTKEAIGASVLDGVASIAGALGAKSFRARWHSTEASVLAAALVHHALQPASERLVLEAEALRGPPA